jgi:hypothetical protein
MPSKNVLEYSKKCAREKLFHPATRPKKGGGGGVGNWSGYLLKSEPRSRN